MGVAASTDRVHGVLDNSTGRKIQVGLEHEHTYTLMDTHRSTSTLALKLLEMFFFFFSLGGMLTLTKIVLTCTKIIP